MGKRSPLSTKPQVRVGTLKGLVKPIIRIGLPIYFATLKCFDEAMSKIGFQRRKRILIDCFEVFHYHHIKPVVDSLLKDARVRVFLLENPNFSRQVVPQHFVPSERFVRSSQIRHIPFDLTISLDYVTPRWYPPRGVKIAAPHGGGMKANYNTPERLARHDVLWVVGERQKNNFRKAMPNNATVEDIGFIVTDQLLNKSCDAAQIRRRLQIDNTLPTALYAPSWSDNPEMILMSDEILRTLHRQEQCNIIVRPHPLLLRPSRTGGKDYGKILSQLTNERFRVAREEDTPIQEYMIASDVLISDLSSVVFEFLFLDRPILLQRNASVIAYYNGEDYFNDILPVVSVFEDAGQLPEKLQLAFGNPNALSLERQRFLAREYYNIGRATEAAVHSVYTHLDLALVDGHRSLKAK